jgi:hypothetical protein
MVRYGMVRYGTEGLPVRVSSSLQPRLALITCPVHQAVGQVDVCSCRARAAFKRTLAGLPLVIQQVLELCSVGGARGPFCDGFGSQNGL